METLSHDELMAGLLVSEDTEDFELTLSTGKKIILKIKELSWTEQSDAFAKSFGVRADAKGNPVAEFDPSVFRVEILKRKIVKSPIPFTEQVIRKLKEDVGSQLNSLVPDPFGPMKVAQDAPKD